MLWKTVLAVVASNHNDGGNIRSKVNLEATLLAEGIVGIHDTINRPRPALQPNLLDVRSSVIPERIAPPALGSVEGLLQTTDSLRHGPFQESQSVSG